MDYNCGRLGIVCRTFIVSLLLLTNKQKKNSVIEIFPLIFLRVAPVAANKKIVNFTESFLFRNSPTFNLLVF